MSDKKEREKRKAKVASARRAAENSAGKQSKAFRPPAGMQRFTPKEGEYALAVVGYPAGKGNPDADEGFLACCRRYWAHRGIGANMDSYLCPAQTYGKPCPICSARNDVVKTHGWKSDEARALRASQRGLWLLVDRADEKKGLQLFDVSHFAFGEPLFDKIDRKRPKYDAFHDPDGGFDVEVAFKEEKIGTTGFPKAVDIDFKQRESLPDAIAKQAEGICLDDCLVCLSHDELKAIFESGVGGEEEPEKKPSRPKSKDEDSEPNALDNDDDDDDKEGSQDSDQEAGSQDEGQEVAAPGGDEAQVPEDEDEDDDDSSWGDDDDEQNSTPAATIPMRNGKEGKSAKPVKK